MILRPAEPRDRTQIEALYAAELPHCPGLSGYILDELSVFTTVALDGEAVIGALSVALCADRWVPGAALHVGHLLEVLAVAVAPDRRRAGIGRSLMETAHAFAADTCARQLEASVLERQGAIHGLLWSLGWVSAGDEEPTMYPGGERALRVSAEARG